jgi:maleate isomerase
MDRDRLGEGAISNAGGIRYATRGGVFSTAESDHFPLAEMEVAMDGSTGRIGVIYPSDGILDDEFWRCVPPGVSVHVTRTHASIVADTPLSAAQQHVVMAESTDIDEAARTFSLIGAGCVAYACTCVSFGRGVGFDSDIVDRIEAASGSRATTTSTAAVAALRALGVRRVAVAAPYDDEVCERLRSFLEGSGFEVVGMANLGLSGAAIGAVPTERVLSLCREADTPDADGLFISCTALRTIDVLDGLEQRLGKPVVSANQATMWHALRIAGIDDVLDGLGRLYRIRPDATAPRATGAASSR